ncbi:MAG TPA: septal ring lytic transglycosylase RlpA family protein [Rubrobacteraceae bacterium]|nr:septal ring lytic transglycosylase RlpA family protein [Rubrobacteraceae bacterium]
MKRLLKVFVLAGVMAFALAATGKDASAEPVLTSWYGPGFAGNLTASGEVFNPQEYTAAHPYLPFGTLLEVCYADCVTVRVNDRGPYVHGRGLDLSQGSAYAIGLGGVDYVDVEIVRYGW